MVGFYTSIVLNNIGLPVISYWDVSAFDLKMATCNNLACDNPALTTIDDTSANVGTFSSIQMKVTGSPVISYHDESNKDLKIAICNDALCSDPIRKVLDETGNNMGRYSSLALSAAGLPVISYHDFDNKDLKMAICTDALCDNVTLRTVDDSVDEVGEHSSIQLNSNGLPVISYYDATNEDLKIAVCNNAICTQPTLTRVDTNGNVGTFTSLSLTVDDYPVISYRDETNGDVKIAVCNDIACTNPTLTSVDSEGSFGEFSSLALNSDGYPVISYFAGTGKADLKIAIFDQHLETSTPEPTPTATQESIPTTPSPPADISIYFPIIVRE